MSWVRVIEGKLTPMAQVHGFWSEAIHAGVRALGFSIEDVAGEPRMIARIADDDVHGPVRRAAAAAIEVDKDVAAETKLTLMTQARTALMVKLGTSAATVELDTYQRVLAIAVLKRVAPDPARRLEALADPYE